MSITYQQHEAHARAVRQDHDGRTSRGLSVEIARLAFDNPIFRDDPVELLSDLKQCAAACIGAGCEPRVRPLPGQDGQGVSLAAPAEADQVEDTPTLTLEQFHRWLEAVAHKALLDCEHPPADQHAAYHALHFERCMTVTAHCNVASRLLMQFMHGAVSHD